MSLLSAIRKSGDRLTAFFKDGTSAEVNPSPTAMSDTMATSLGFKVYSHGGTYKDGLAPTITLTAGGGTLSSVNLSEFIPYQTQGGSWRLKFNVRTTLSATTRTEVQLTVAGVTSVAFLQSISGFANTAQSVTASLWNVSSGQMRVLFASGGVANGHFSGDIALTSKPTWAY